MVTHFCGGLRSFRCKSDYGSARSADDMQLALTEGFLINVEFAVRHKKGFASADLQTLFEYGS